MPEPDELDRLGYTAEEKATLLKTAAFHGWSFEKTLKIAEMIMGWAMGISKDVEAEARPE